MILVSSCLAGHKVRYDASDCYNNSIAQLLQQQLAIPVCPELLGGFSTPREPAEIVGGNGDDVLNGRAKVYDASGNDVTDLYITGAEEALKKAKELSASIVILKENSPSCGSGKIYDGSFSGKKVEGTGVTAALFKQNGIKVFSEKNLDEINHLLQSN